MKDLMKKLTEGKKNFVFLGEAGSGKSEIAINFARYLTELGDKPVHFFDMDMTKPLFRSRDVVEQVESMGIIFHYEEQFFDAPTLVGGVNLLLKDDSVYVVMDVGGNDTGARAIGGYAPKVNRENTAVYFVLNAYRPWSGNIDDIDRTLGLILGISHIELGQIHMVNNPNIGISTTAEEVISGCRQMEDMVNPYMEVEFACVKEELYGEVESEIGVPVLPIRLYLTYEWLSDDMNGGT